MGMAFRTIEPNDSWMEDIEPYKGPCEEWERWGCEYVIYSDDYPGRTPLAMCWCHPCNETDCNEFSVAQYCNTTCGCIDEDGNPPC